MPDAIAIPVGLFRDKLWYGFDRLASFDGDIFTLYGDEDGFVEVEGEIDQAGAELLAAEEALMQRIAAQTAKNAEGDVAQDEFFEDDEFLSSPQCRPFQAS